MFFFCLYLYFNIKKLKEQITKLEQENKTILEKKLTPNKEDLISIETISQEKTKDTVEEDKNKTTIPKTIKPLNNQAIINFPNNKQFDKTISKNTYKFQHPNQVITPREIKYVARTNNVDEYQKPNILPPTISNLNKATSQDDNNTPKNVTNTTQNMTMPLSFNPDEFIKQEPKNTFKANNNYQTSPNKYLEEISKHLADEITPQTIDLTDYEKIQEEQAIISYQELLTLKEKNNLNEKDEENFVEDLKELYSLLD